MKQWIRARQALLLSLGLLAAWLLPLIQWDKVVLFQRAEHGVQVHVHQVPEVGLVGGGKGIHRLVREGHGVQEGGHAALEQLQKRRGHGVLLAARQH